MGEQWMSVSRGSRTETVEVSEDFSLPDYVPEVRRVLGVVRDATADNGFRDGTTYLQEGNVCYTVFYLGEDGQVTSVPLSSAYSAKVPLPEHLAAQKGPAAAGPVLPPCGRRGCAAAGGFRRGGRLCDRLGSRKCILPGNVAASAVPVRPASDAVPCSGA